MKDIDGYFQALGLGPDATLVDVKKAYRDLVQIYHPDRLKPSLQETANQHLARINSAYERLESHFERQTLDSASARSEPPKGSCSHSDDHDRREFSAPLRPDTPRLPNIPAIGLDLGRRRPSHQRDFRQEARNTDHPPQIHLSPSVFIRG